MGGYGFPAWQKTGGHFFLKRFFKKYAAVLRLSLP
jgi:hypothetical protein